MFFPYLLLIDLSFLVAHVDMWIIDCISQLLLWLELVLWLSYGHWDRSTSAMDYFMEVVFKKEDKTFPFSHLLVWMEI